MCKRWKTQICRWCIITIGESGRNASGRNVSGGNVSGRNIRALHSAGRVSPPASWCRRWRVARSEKARNVSARNVSARDVSARNIRAGRVSPCGE